MVTFSNTVLSHRRSEMKMVTEEWDSVVRSTLRKWFVANERDSETRPR